MSGDPKQPPNGAGYPSLPNPSFGNSQPLNPSPSPSPAPVPIPSKNKAPPDPALTKVVIMATDAVKMDRAGRFKDAKQSYMLAAQELITVCRSSVDPLRRVAYKKRANTYLKRAEEIDKMLRRQANQKRQTIQARKQATWFVNVIGPELVMAGEETTTKPTPEVFAGKAIVCIFVGGNWSEACRAFLPDLQKFYTLVCEEHPDELEIIYVSQDRTQKEYEAFYRTQAWPSMPFHKKPQIGRLMAHCGFYARNKHGLIVLDAKSGQVLNKNAVQAIVTNPNVTTYESWTKLLTSK